MELAAAFTLDVENPIAGDMRLSGGNVVWLTDLASEVDQRLRSRLQFVRGEWFLDRRKGFPYFQVVFVKDPDLKVIRSLYSKTIRTTQGVAAINTLNLALSTAERKLALDFSLRLSDGTTFLSRDYPPFILEV